MNSYGQQALESWRILAPTALSEIPDPSSFFQALGEEAATSVAELTLRLAGADVPTETYLQKAGRLKAARLQAEEIIRRDLLMPAPELVEDIDEGDLMGPYEQVVAAAQDLLDEYRKG